MIKKKSKIYADLNNGMDAANKHTNYENIMDVRNRLIALWWADYIYRKLNNKQACDHDWWSQAFIVG